MKQDPIERNGRVEAGVREPDAPLLIIVSEGAEPSAMVRSPHRVVRRWIAQIDPSTADAARCFTGEVTAAATYAWARGTGAVSAVIDFADAERAHAVKHAIRSVRPDSAVLMLCAGCQEQSGTGTLARSGRLRDVLRLDLDEELERLEAERRLSCLRAFAAGAPITPILIHDDADADAISSAAAVRHLLAGSVDTHPIITTGPFTRPEVERMIELLRLRVTLVTPAELHAFDRIIAVDMQPVGLTYNGRPRLAVIDHHPIEIGYDAAFFDVRPDVGATATLLTQYLRSSGERAIPPDLAAALIRGIRTDTDMLSRGVSEADIHAYAFLHHIADSALLRRMERPAIPVDVARAMGRSVAEVVKDGNIAVAFLDRSDPDVIHRLAELADFCITIDGVSWAAACARAQDGFVVALRHFGRPPGAGELAQRIAELGGKGGGHASMARVTLSFEVVRERFGDGAAQDTARAVLRLLKETLAGMR